MPTSHLQTPDTLALATRDISRHIAGLADELLRMHHNTVGGGTPAQVLGQQLNKIRDQIALLSAVVNDLAKAEPQA